MGSLSYNLYQGNYTDAAIDAGGLVIDVAATLIPVVPGGAGAAIKAVRTADKVGGLVDAAKTGNGASNVVQGVNQAAIDAGFSSGQADIIEGMARLNQQDHGLLEL